MLDFLICYEHKAREYLYYSLIRYEMQRRGYSVKMCHYSFRNHWIYQIFSKPKVVIGPWGHNNIMFPGEYENTMVDWCMDTLRGRADYYINMQMEQVFRSDKAKGNVNLNTQENTFNICWGPLRKQQLLEMGFREDRLLLTGAVHLDCLRPEMEGLYREKSEVAQAYGLDVKKKWVLFISGFVFASKSVTMMKKEANQLINSGVDMSVEDILRDREVSVLSQYIIMDWIEQYLKENDLIFIYRPHPGEFETECVKKVRMKYPHNFYLIREEPVQQWIKVSDFIMLWNSTSVAEVFTAKKKCCIVQPFPLSSNLEPPLMDEGCVIETFDEFQKELDGDWTFDKDQFPIKKENIYQYYLFDTRPAYINICDYLEEIIKLPKISSQKSKFTKKILLSKAYIRFRYMDFYCFTHIKFSRIFPFGRKKLANAELAYDSSRTKADVELSKDEKNLYKRAKKFVYKNRKEKRVC